MLLVLFVAFSSGDAFCQSVRDATVWPFATDSVWNLPIATTAVFDAVSGKQTVNLAQGKFYAAINSETWSIPIYYAAATDPLATVVWIDMHDLSFKNMGTFSYRIPFTAEPAQPLTSGDQNLDIIAPDRRHVNETWFMQGANPNWQTGFYHYTDLFGPGYAEGGARAYGGSTLAGLIRHYDVQQGIIRHALALAVDTTQLYAHDDDSGMCVGFVWPAISQDLSACTAGSLYLGLNPIGTYAAIPPTVNLQQLGLTSVAGWMVARAAQQYGVYVVDRTGGGANAFYAEAGIDAAWLSQLRASYDLDRIRHALRVVLNNSPSTPNGGAYDGTAKNRAAPLAPELN